MNKPPASIFVLSILGILLGSFGILGNMAVWFLPLFRGTSTAANIFDDALHQETLYRAGMLTIRIVAPLLAILLISCSAGSLALRPSARRGMLLYAGLKITFTVLDALFVFLYVYPKVLAAVSPAISWTIQVSLFVSAGFTLLSFAFPVCILYFFNRPLAKDAFRGILPPPISNFPVQFP